MKKIGMYRAAKVGNFPAFIVEAETKKAAMEKVRKIRNSKVTDPKTPAKIFLIWERTVEPLEDPDGNNIFN